MWIDKQKTINLQLEMPVRLSTYRKGNAIPPLPGTSIFHSTELFHVFEMTRGYEPLLIVAYIGNRPVGKLLAVIRKSVRLFPPAIIKRCEIYGTGEYFDEAQNKEDLFGEMLEHLTNEVLCKSFLIEFRNLENPLFGYKAFRKNNYFAINWLRVRNSLHSKAPYERLSMSRRRQINKALRNGAIMEIADNEKSGSDRYECRTIGKPQFFHFQSFGRINLDISYRCRRINSKTQFTPNDNQFFLLYIHHGNYITLIQINISHVRTIPAPDHFQTMLTG